MIYSIQRYCQYSGGPRRGQLPLVWRRSAAAALMECLHRDPQRRHRIGLSGCQIGYRQAPTWTLPGMGRQVAKWHWTLRVVPRCAGGQVSMAMDTKSEPDRQAAFNQLGTCQPF
ncbi:hypothetical protein GCM10023317_39970 [Actinopolymorpha pittospori]|uniref:Uncharacterized protein n=1 Tax=Actinopolymorpha pittospori TaxID=648752 RepID=A0A927RMB9_9ACTN|nr:hypothetical protein [Actinopolymorpha pittospori]